MEDGEEKEEKEEKWRMEEGRAGQASLCTVARHLVPVPCLSPPHNRVPRPDPSPPPPATSFRVLVQRGVDLTWQPPIRCSAHPIQYSYSRPAFSDASRGGSSPGRCATRSYHVSPSFRCSVVLCPPCCCPTYPALFATLGNALPAVLLSDLPCSLCYTPHFRPPAVVAFRQVCGAKMWPIGGAVARFRAAAASSYFPIRGVSIPAFGGARTCAVSVTPWGCRPLSSPAQSIEARLKKKLNRNVNKFRPSHADSNTDRKRRLFQNWET